MRDLTKLGQRWRCAQCVSLLSYLELRQDPITGDVFCVECWMSWATMSDTYVVPPLVCEECLIPLRPGRGQQLESWSGVGEWVCVCETCASPPTPEEESDMISGLLRLLEETS